jgi:multiple sugar transport system ATP-binding protein
MNFFDARLVKSDGKLFVEHSAFNVQIPDDRTQIYMPYEGKAIIFGIRPEDIYDPEFPAPGIIAQNVDGSIEVTELMGNEIFVYLQSGDTDYVARVDPRTSFKMGDQVQVAFNMGNMHIFDKETEQAIR